MDKKIKLLTRKQYEQWYKTIPKNVCTFCQWEKYQIVLKEFEYWVWIANLAPYWRWHTMIIPKRHFVGFSEMSFREAGELVRVIDYGEKKMIDGDLKRKNGTIVDTVVYFWRFRFNRVDPATGNIRPDHFHLHLSPDKDHRWDSTIDTNAYKVNISKLKEK